MESSAGQKYVLYALGEIVLVVLGILIALQVSEWNQVRKDKVEEEVILQNLHTEFVQNKEELNRQVALLDQSRQACLIFMDLMSKSSSGKIDANLDSLMYWVIEYSPYTPSNNVVSDLLQSGRLNLISNTELRNDIFEWTRELEYYKLTFDELQKFIESQVLHYLVQRIALKNVDIYGPLKWSESSKFQSDVEGLLLEREFENLIDNHLYHLNGVSSHFDDLNGIIGSILNLASNRQ